MKNSVYIVKQGGTLWGVYTMDPEPYFDLFAEVTGYEADDFYVERMPLSEIPTADNIGSTYS